jgi:4-amino-4-deoxy-L-arabinose transferase-like glycosyltransferase
LLLGIAIGLGGLTKGPAILVHVVPIALTAPIWGPRLSKTVSKGDHSLLGWNIKVLLAICFGLIVTLVWAIPAGLAGGEDYFNAIFWGQTAGRITSSFAHQRAWWWYLLMSPLLLFPWLLWPPLWTAISNFKYKTILDGGILFCLIWFLVPFIVFSFISGKQLHYLAPELSSLSLLISIGLSKQETFEETLISRLLPAVIFVIIGLVILFVPVFVSISWVNEVKHGWGILVIILGLWMLQRSGKEKSLAIRQLAVASVGLVFVTHLALESVLSKNYNVTSLAQKLKTWQEAGYALANFGKYHGQYQFLGRLRKPITVIGVLAEQKKRFLKEHPEGRIIAYYEELPVSATPVLVFPFRQKTIAIWEARDFLYNPKLGNRQVNK